MKQLVLDLGLAAGPSLNNFCIGRNAALVGHLKLWLGQTGSGARPGSSVPIYFWGTAGSGKTHLLNAVRLALLAQGQQVGWLDDRRLLAYVRARRSAVPCGGGRCCP